MKPKPKQKRYRMLQSGETLIRGDEEILRCEWVPTKHVGDIMTWQDVGYFRRPIKKKEK